MAFLLALLAALLGSLGMIVESHLVREKNPNAVSPAQRLAFGALLNLGMLGGILLFKPDEFWLVPVLATGAILLSIGCLDMAYNYLYLKALQKTPASQVTPIVSLNPVFTLALSTLLPGVVNSLSILMIVLIVIPGVYLITLDLGSTKKVNLLAPFRTRVFKVAMSAAVFTGISAVLIDFALANQYVSELTLLFMRMGIMTLLTMAIFKPKLFPDHHKRINWIIFLVLVELMFVVERIAQTYAIGLGNVSLVVTIVSVSPVFVLIFDGLFFKERMSVNKLIGTLLVVAGIIFAGLQL